jgi:hypothetical protein
MAHTRNIQDNPDPGTKEEDRSNPDMHSGTEKGVEATHAAAEHPVQQLQQQQQPPAWRGIPEGLYDKAYDDPDQLSQEERQILLSRGDVVGKALASPHALTTAEMHEVLLWPPPDVTRANIQRATGGTLSSPVELFAKAKDAIDRGQFDTLVSDEETALLARFFSGPDDEGFYLAAKERRINALAPGRAYSLVFELLGLHHAVTSVAKGSMWDRQPKVPWRFARPPRDPADRLPDHLERFREQLEAAEDAFRAAWPPRPDPSWKGVARPVPDADRNAPGPWPPGGVERTGAFRLFEQDAEPGCCGFTIDSPEWHCLPEDQKAAYRARAEARRREAWAEFETACAARGPPAPGSVPPSSGFEHFRLGPGADVEFAEVLRRWEAFSKRQRSEWETRAWSAVREEAWTREREMWEMRDLGPEEKEEAQAPSPRGRKRYESVEAWKARRAMERRAEAEGARSVQDVARNLAASSIPDNHAQL